MSMGNSTLTKSHFYVKEIMGMNFHIDTIFFTWVVMAILIIAALITKKRLTLIPSPLSLQHIFELLIGAFDDLAKEVIGEEGKKYTPFVATIFIFILLCNWLGIIPLCIPPSQDYNTTLALAIISFIGFNFYGIKKRGSWKWFTHYVEPVPNIARSMEGLTKYSIVPFLVLLFIPLNLIEELARIISLSVRLFGNIMGEHTVIVILLGLVVTSSYILDPIPILVSLIGLLAGAIQALIFAILTLFYIGGAVGEHH